MSAYSSAPCFLVSVAAAGATFDFLVVEQLVEKRTKAPKAMALRVWLVLIICELLGANAFAQSQKTTSYAKELPTGLVRVSFYTLIGIEEVSNLEYRAYLSALLKDSSAASYKAAIPDTLTLVRSQDWDRAIGFYFSNPNFEKYPVVGVTRSQAMAYCRWRTEQYQITKSEMQFDSLEFHLPSRELWLEAAQGDSTRALYPFPKRKARKFIWSADKAGRPAIPRAGGKPNSIGTVNMNGNVAELVESPFLTLGGSFVDPLRACSNYATKTLTDVNIGECWLGFRYAATIVRE